MGEGLENFVRQRWTGSSSLFVWRWTTSPVTVVFTDFLIDCFQRKMEHLPVQSVDRILLAEGEKLYECQTGRNPMDKDTVTGLIVENRQKKGLYGIKNVSQGVWRGFYPDGKIKDIPNGQGIPIWNGMSVRFELGEEWNLRLMQQVEERKEDEDEQTV